MIKTYTYKLKPNKNIEHKFNRWLGTCRFVYNCSKDLSEQSYLKGVRLTGFDIANQLVPAKKELPWVAGVHSQTLQAIIERYSGAMKKFFKGGGYPRWATKRGWKSVPFKSIKTTNNAFRLPSFGTVKVFSFKRPKGTLKTASLIREADGIYLKVAVDEGDIEKANGENQAVCGIDMGIAFFLTTSDGEFVDNPKHLFARLKELRTANRSLARKKKGGKNFYKQVERMQLLHQKVGRARKDFLHKESRKLADRYGTIVREDLNIKGMSKNTKLSKHILDCGWGTFFGLLEYKTNVVKVDPKHTSQQCSECGHTCGENRKTQSLFECVRCGYMENADLQATYNILQRGQSLLEAKVAC